MAGDFSDGLAPVQVGDRWGYIDKNGKVAISPQFNDARGFSSGLAPVGIGTNWGYIDKSGKFVWNPSA